MNIVVSNVFMKSFIEAHEFGVYAREAFADCVLHAVHPFNDVVLCTRDGLLVFGVVPAKEACDDEEQCYDLYDSANVATVGEDVGKGHYTIAECGYLPIMRYAFPKMAKSTVFGISSLTARLQL